MTSDEQTSTSSFLVSPASTSSLTSATESEASSAISVNVPISEEAQAEVAAVVEAEQQEVDLGYQVTLDSFSGPLDLLLYLVRRSEVAITDIPIAEVTDQFIALMDHIDDLDLDVAGDFILMAATLLELKARFIRPPEESGEEAEDEDDEWLDPRADLIRQLLAYREVKEAVLALEELEQTRHRWHQRKYAEQLPAEEDEDFDLENADPYALFACWDNILKSVAGQRDRTVLYDDIPMSERMDQLANTMAEAGEAKLSWLLDHEKTVVRRCGVIIAMLESVRQKVVEATQYEQYGDVELRFIDLDERQRPVPAPPELDAEDEIGPDGKKKRRRRKRLPLMTYQAPESDESDSSKENGAGEGGSDEIIPDEPIVVQTEEQRFTDELNQNIGIDALLQRIKHLDEHLQAHIAETLQADESTESDNPDAPTSGEEETSDEEEEYDDEDEFDDEDDEEYDDEDDFDDEDDECDDEGENSIDSSETNELSLI